MDTVEKLKEHIEMLEKHLIEEKKFRDQMNNVMKFNDARNKRECEFLRGRLTDQIRQINKLTEDLETSQDDLLMKQAQYKVLRDSILQKDSIGIDD